MVVERHSPLGGVQGRMCVYVGVRGGVFLQPPGVIRSISQIGKMPHMVGSNTHCKYLGLFRFFDIHYD